jgi:tetracycline repressor-like protein
MLRSLLTEGVKAGAFGVRDVAVTATAILTMCSEVSDWFSSRGRLSAEAVADEYASMVQQLVGHRDGRASSGSRPRSVPAATRRKTRRRHPQHCKPAVSSTAPLAAECPRRLPRGAADRTSTALGARA